MLSWRNARTFALPAALFTATFLAGPVSAQVTGTPDPQSTSGSSASQPRTTAAQPGVAEANTAPGYNTAPALHRDLAISAFAQISGSKVGNFIRNDTTGSGGGLLSYRYTFKPWFGYEVNYGLTKFTDSYYYGVIRIPHNAHEFSLAYVLQGPRFSGVTPFLTLGGGAIVFAPTSGASSSYGVDPKKMFVYGIGLQHAIVNDRWGVRLQYRGLTYGVPAFGQINLNTHRSRMSSEPSIGVYHSF